MSDASHVLTSAAADFTANSGERLMGFLIVGIFPALFWTVLAAAGGWSMGYQMSPMTLAAMGASISAFLLIVFASLTHGSRA